MDMDNYNRGLRGFPRDINQDYWEYSKGRNIRELTYGPDLPGGGGGAGGGCFGIVAIVLTLLPFILISSIAAAFSAILYV